MAGWREATLGACIEINGSTWSPKEAWPFVNYLDTGSVTENRISEIRRLIPGRDEIPSRARRKVRPGEIVYSTVRPNQRHFGLMRDVPENFLASTGFSVIRGKEGVACTDFVYWFLAQPHVVDLLHTIAETSTSAYPSIRPADIEGLTLDLPPLPEQRAIAGVLCALDDKIESNRRMNGALEGLARAVFEDWFVDFGPVRAKLAGRAPYLPDPLWSLFPNRLVESEAGEIPEGWKRWRLDELALHRKESVNPSSEPHAVFEHYSLPAHDTGRQPVMDRGANIKSNKISVPEGAVLLSKLNPEIPRVWVPEDPSGFRQIASPEFLVFVPKSGFGRVLLSGLFLSHGFRQLLQGMVTGTSRSHQRVPHQALTISEIIAGDSKVFSAFESILSPLLYRQIWNRRESRTLAGLRDTLLPKLVSGEIRLGDTEGEDGRGTSTRSAQPVVVQRRQPGDLRTVPPLREP